MQRIIRLTALVLVFMATIQLPASVHAFTWGTDHQKSFTIENDTTSPINIIFLYHHSIYLCDSKRPIFIPRNTTKIITYYKEDLVRSKYIKVNGTTHKVQSGEEYSISSLTVQP